jgi:serine protease Do
MRDVLDPVDLATTSVGSVSTPPPPPPTDPTPPERPRGRRRFLGGFVVGLVVAGLVFGAIALIARGRDEAPTEPRAPEAPARVADEPNERAGGSDAGGSSVAVDAPAGSVHDLVVAVRPSIVAIHTTVTQTDVFGRRLEGDAAGSGFVLSSDGYIVTNDHVVDGADTISVTLDDGTSEEATLVGADRRSDLAVLRIDRDDLTPLAIGDSDAIRVGDPVVAIGNALDLGAEPTVTGGLVSAKDRTITTPTSQVLVNLIQTDAAISPGNSGGPLLDMQGRVVGINTAVAGEGQNIGFALAINPAMEFIDDLRNGDVPRHALLGVSTARRRDGSPGAVVTDVAVNSGAEAAGVRVGDVITELDGETVETPQDLVAAIARRSPGDTVGLTVERDGDTIELTATLGAHDEVRS